MDALRRVPLFVRIGLMWWVVLLAWPWSRPFVFFDVPLADIDPSRVARPTDVTPLDIAAGAASLAYAIGAAWIIVKVVAAFAPAANWGIRLGRGVFLAWFAVGGWAFCLLAWDIVSNSADILDRFVALAWATVYCLLGAPMFAFIVFWRATWILIPLGFLSVLIVDRATVRAEVRAPA